AGQAFSQVLPQPSSVNRQQLIDDRIVGAVRVRAELEPGAIIVYWACCGPVDKTPARDHRLATEECGSADPAAVDYVLRRFEQTEIVHHGGNPQVQIAVRSASACATWSAVPAFVSRNVLT
ncbi:MAG: hypothetical protein ACRDTG_31460, partial [Pseudonocardiaceae bacterium]